MEVLRLQGLSKYYTSSGAVVMGLSGIDLSFATGEFVAITGESGSGKSTLAHVLGGILPYEAGELYINGRPTSHYSAADWERYRRDLVGFISQSYGILAGNTVMENVISALRLGGMDKDAARAAAEDILEEVELSEFKTRRAGKLSSGQKQRLSIARALAKPSKILIADEPTGNLDRENSDKVIRLLKRASRDRLVILITHEFEEAKDAATRKIVLSDGKVVADAQTTAGEKASAADKEDASAPDTAVKHSQKQPVLYVAGLTVKSRPIFTSLLCAFLVLTTLMTFVFLGNFIIALDDTNTRIYDSDVFVNGAPERIVVMKDGRSPFSGEELLDILDIKYVENLEARGYICDIAYYYRPEVDYHEYQDIVNGPNYHPVTNPDDYQVTNLVKFYEGDPQFMRTVPVMGEDILTAGRLATSFYEVVSADPSYHVGDTVKVYVRNTTDWSISAYYCAVFDVVGETNEGEGLYFSDDMGAAMSTSVKSTWATSSNGYIFAPYDPSRYVTEPLTEALSDNTFLHPAAQNQTIEIGSSMIIAKGEELYPMSCVGYYETAYRRMLLVSDATFHKLTDTTSSNQISIYIKDYAYADRVLDALGDKGYVAVSPFRMSATEIDPDLATERLVTLAVCLSALILTMILQLILLRAMFSALHEHFRLLSNIGLTAKTAKAALFSIFVGTTLAGEVLGMAIIFSLNSQNLRHISDIFKYFDTLGIILLFAVHFISILPALLMTIRSLKRAVFPESTRVEDIDLSLMEADI